MADSKQDNTPYVDALLEYSARETGRFQVPGHKGGLAADPAMIELVGMTGLINDVPSVTEGVDIGPEPTPFQQAQLLAAEAWGARRTWFLINGASQGNHATSMALGHMGNEMVVQRNVHSSIIDGLVLNGMRPSFVSPELDPELGIAHGLTPESLAAALDATPNAVAALVVSPTYFGACADVAALADVAHSRGLPLICDEAWAPTSTSTPTCRRTRWRAAPTWSPPRPTRSSAASPRRRCSTSETATGSTRRSSTAASAWSKRPAPAACSPVRSTRRGGWPRSTAKSS